MEPGDPVAGSGQVPPVSTKDGVASRAIRLTDLDPAARRRALVRCGLTIVLSWVFVVARSASCRSAASLAFSVRPAGPRHRAHRGRVRLADTTDLRRPASGTPGRRGPGDRGRGLPRLVLGHLPGDVPRRPEDLHADPRPHPSALLHDLHLLDGWLRRHHAEDRYGACPRLDPDVARPRIIGAAVRLIFSAARSRIAPTSTVGVTRPEGQRERLCRRSRRTTCE